MRSRQILTTVSVALSLTLACNAQAGQAPKTAKLDTKVYDHFGTGITVGKAPISLQDALKNAGKLTGKTIRVQAPITGVCQAKGCWMKLGKLDEQGNPPLFVKFKDYGFFMPKDASGRLAIVEGTLAYKQETVAETRHYLEDEGKHEAAKKVTEGRKILKFVASGVALEKVAVPVKGKKK